MIQFNLYSSIALTPGKYKNEKILTARGIVSIGEVEVSSKCVEVKKRKNEERLKRLIKY